MSDSKEPDLRLRLIALAASIAIVLIANFLYNTMRRNWYGNKVHVIKRMHEECMEFRLKQVDRLPKESQPEWQNKVLQECHKIKETCERDFQQRFCLLAQRQFMNPE